MFMCGEINSDFKRAKKGHRQHSVCGLYSEGLFFFFSFFFCITLKCADMFDIEIVFVLLLRQNEDSGRGNLFFYLFIFFNVILCDAIFCLGFHPVFSPVELFYMARTL